MSVKAKLYVYVRQRGEQYRGRVVQVTTTGLTAKYYECYGGFCRRVDVRKVRGRWRYDEWPYDGSAECRRNGPHPHRWKPIPRRLHAKATKGRA